MPIELDEDRISDLVDHLEHSILQKAPKTHFPVQLPLAFPTSLHHVNLLTVLHLVSITISQPRHTQYLAETNSNAHDLTIRGVFGLFLASDESWGAQNMLSSKAWRQGAMDEATVGEFFGLDIMRERDHPSMPVKIGERWKPGVDLAGDLVGLFRRLADRLPLRCVGEAVLAALGRSEEDSKGQKGSARHMTYARAFCNKVIEYERLLADPYPAPTDGAVLPAAPLLLLQDLSALLPILTDLKVAAPKPDDLSHLSPLPLSTSLILQLGLIDFSHSSLPGSDLETLRAATSEKAKPVSELLSPSSSPMTNSASTAVSVSAKTYAALQTASVEVCRHIWGAARFSRSRDGEGDWKHELSFLDVERICSELSSSGAGRIALVMTIANQQYHERMDDAGGEDTKAGITAALSRRARPGVADVSSVDKLEKEVAEVRQELKGMKDLVQQLVDGDHRRSKRRRGSRARTVNDDYDDDDDDDREDLRRQRAASTAGGGSPLSSVGGASSVAAFMGTMGEDRRAKREQTY